VMLEEEGWGHYSRGPIPLVADLLLASLAESRSYEWVVMPLEHSHESLPKAL
jgi:hypothetical protein